MTFDRICEVDARRVSMSRLPCAIASTLLMVACTVGHGSVDAQNLRITHCDSPEQIAKSTSATSVNHAEAGFEIAAGSAETVRIEQVFRITSPCLDSFEKYGMGTVVMSRSGALVIRKGMVFSSDGSNGESYFANQPVFLSLSGLPDVPGQFLIGIEVQPPSKSDSWYFGVWQDRTQYVVVAFQLNAAGRTGRAIPILKSRSRPAGLTYFPPPDGNGGNIGILAKDGSVAYTASIRWSGIMEK